MGEKTDRKNITIKDVARAAGTSVTTVSRVLSGSGYPVKKELKERILKVAKELGYKPQGGAGMGAIKTFRAGKLNVKIYETRKELGESAAWEMAGELKRLLETEDEVNIIFAAAPSQNEFLEHLTKIEGIEWNRVNAFHMDEYIGLNPDAPQRFGNFLRERIFDKVGFRSVSYIDGNAENPREECARYANLLKKHPPHIVCMGIGENGHIAFNDPHVALFDDPELVKIVELDEKCRQQQVNDGCFGKIEEVPKYALTLTIPMLLSAKTIYCMVPGKTKTQAVTRTVTGEITQDCPASILKTHANATLYVDKDSGAGIL